MIKLSKWNDETTCRFVHLYKTHECLWNLESPTYKNKMMREKALEIIMKEMAIEGFGKNEVKNKIRSLRSTYNLEIQKIEKSYRSGIESSDVYRPCLKWFYIMKEIMTNIGTVKRKLQDVDFQDEYEETHIININTINCGIEMNNRNELQKDETPTTAATAIQLSSAPATSTTPKRRRTKLDLLNSTMRNLKDILATKGKDESNDEFDECVTFGKYVGLQLKKLSCERRILTQSAIQNLLTGALLNQLHGIPHSSIPSIGTSLTDTSTSYFSELSHSDTELLESPSVEQKDPIFIATFEDNKLLNDNNVKSQSEDILS